MRIGRAKELIKSLIKGGSKTSIMLYGPPGIGKSAIIKQIGSELELRVIDLRILLYQPIDLRGGPVPNRDKKIIEWYAPDFLPQSERDGVKGILFFDEINCAPAAVQNAALQLILDRQCGSYILPEGWFVIAAGNRAVDGALVYESSAALQNRFLNMCIEPHKDDFKEYALSMGFHPVVIGYIEFRPDHLLKVPDSKWEPAWPSPRTWEFVSRHLDMVPEEYKYDLVASAVGEGIATEFMAYYRTSTKLVDPELILEGKSTEVPKEFDMQYVCLLSMIAKLRIKAGAKRISNFLKILDKFPPDLQMMAIKDGIRSGLKKEFFSSPDFATWAKREAEFI